MRHVLVKVYHLYKNILVNGLAKKTNRILVRVCIGPDVPVSVNINYTIVTIKWHRILKCLYT